MNEKFVIIFLFPFTVFAQQIEYRFFIGFNNKDGSRYSINNPEEFLTQRSLDRRISQNINIKISDLPVNNHYVSYVRSLGFEIKNRTRWMNGVIVATTDSSFAEQLTSSFIDSVIYFGRSNHQNKHEKATISFHFPSDYGSALNQIYMI